MAPEERRGLHLSFGRIEEAAYAYLPPLRWFEACSGPHLCPHSERLEAQGVCSLPWSAYPLTREQQSKPPTR